MAKKPDPFELEPEASPAAQPAKADVPAAEDAQRPPPAAELSYEQRLQVRAEERQGQAEVDTRTVAERQGRLRTSGLEVLPAPARWPSEALRFPLLAPGPSFAAMVVTLLVLLDAMSISTDLRFLAWLLKWAFYAVLLRAQVGIAGMSAAGRDEPVGWLKALEFGYEDMRQLLGVLGPLCVALAPALVLFLADVVPWAVASLVAASLYASVVTLGWAVSDSTLRRPWKAVVWIAAQPLSCVAVALSWWIVIASEFALGAQVEQGIVLTVFLSLVLRALDAYVLLVGARVLGVMGRSWQVDA